MIIHENHPPHNDCLTKTQINSTLLFNKLYLMIKHDD